MVDTKSRLLLDDMRKAWKEMDQMASARSEEFYTDPETGYLVATTFKLKTRGFCCESGCRHCPYGFKK